MINPGRDFARFKRAIDRVFYSLRNLPVNDQTKGEIIRRVSRITEHAQRLGWIENPKYDFTAAEEHEPGRFTFNVRIRKRISYFLEG